MSNNHLPTAPMCMISHGYVRKTHENSTEGESGAGDRRKVTMNPLLLAHSTLPGIVSRLSPRQLEVVEHLAMGMSNKQIGIILSISGKTVKTHIRRACKGVGVENRTQLVVIFAMWLAGKKN